MFALWYFVIWGQVFLQASTVPPEFADQGAGGVRAPSAPR